jgi:hypothetical protein
LYSNASKDVVNLNTLIAASGVVMIALGLPFFVNKTIREAGGGTDKSCAQVG